MGGSGNLRLAFPRARPRHPQLLRGNQPHPPPLRRQHHSELPRFEAVERRRVGEPRRCVALLRGLTVPRFALIIEILAVLLFNCQHFGGEGFEIELWHEGVGFEVRVWGLRD